jgi:hypothetical protein
MRLGLTQTQMGQPWPSWEKVDTSFLAVHPATKAGSFLQKDLVGFCWGVRAVLLQITRKRARQKKKKKETKSKRQ